MNDRLIVPGSASRGVLSPASRVRGDRVRGVKALKSQGRHLPGRVRVRLRLRMGRWRLVWDDPHHCHYERRYTWGDPPPRPAWRNALGLAGFLLLWALLVIASGLIGMAR